MAMRLTLRKSGVRPIMPQDTWAQRRIIFRRASRSSADFGVMNDSPTGSPLLGEA